MKTGMIVLGHGSRRSKVTSAFKAMVSRVAAMIPNTLVLPAFFSLSAPTLKEQVQVLATAGCARIVIMQYFLCNGVHIDQDIPAEITLLRQEYPQVRFVVLPTLEGDPALEQLLVNRLLKA